MRARVWEREWGDVGGERKMIDRGDRETEGQREGVRGGSEGRE